MSFLIPQSTAYTVYFKAFLSSDHVSEATSKTIAMTIMKTGATSFSNLAAGATNATECASGWYKVALGTGDTDTLGALAIRGAVATIDDVGLLYNVIEANDVSDILSRLTITNSQIVVIKSDVAIVDTKIGENDFSDILSAVVIVKSQMAIVKSDVAIVDTKIAELDWSDIGSRLTITNSQLVVVKSDAAHCESKLVQVYSDTGHIDSDIVVVKSQVAIVKSKATQIYSDTTHIDLLTGEGDFSDILSRLTSFTAAAGILSDINSGVDVIQSKAVQIYSDTTHIDSDIVKTLSDTARIDTLATANNSRLVIVQSDTTVLEGTAGASLSSDQDSKLTRVANAIVEVDTSDIMSMLTLIRSDTTHVESAAVVILSDTVAIEASTGGLTYTVPNVIDANIQRVNDVVITGDGGTGTEWGPV